MSADVIPLDPDVERLRQQFVEECRFAKVVNSSHGAAMLIGGQVIDVIAPHTLWGREISHDFFVETITRALRNGSGQPEVSKTASGTLS